MPFTHRGKRTAFTLVELVTVMTIAGIVGVAVIGTTLSQINSVRSRSAAGRMVTDIRYCQRLALGSSLRTWVVFKSGPNNYQLYAEDPNNPGKTHRVAVVNPLEQTTGVVQFGSGPFLGVSISSVNINGTTELEFDSFGIPYDENSVAITANGTIGLSNGVTITVRPVSGFVSQSG